MLTCFIRFLHVCVCDSFEEISCHLPLIRCQVKVGDKVPADMRMVALQSSIIRVEQNLDNLYQFVNSWRWKRKLRPYLVMLQIYTHMPCLSINIIHISSTSPMLIHCYEHPPLWAHCFARSQLTGESQSVSKELAPQEEQSVIQAKVTVVKSKLRNVEMRDLKSKQLAVDEDCMM